MQVTCCEKRYVIWEDILVLIHILVFQSSIGWPPCALHKTIHRPNMHKYHSGFLLLPLDTRVVVVPRERESVGRAAPIALLRLGCSWACVAPRGGRHWFSCIERNGRCRVLRARTAQVWWVLWFSFNYSFWYLTCAIHRNLRSSKNQLQTSVGRKVNEVSPSHYSKEPLTCPMVILIRVLL